MFWWNKSYVSLINSPSSTRYTISRLSLTLFCYSQFATGGLQSLIFYSVSRIPTTSLLSLLSLSFVRQH